MFLDYGSEAVHVLNALLGALDTLLYLALPLHIIGRTVVTAPHPGRVWAGSALATVGAEIGLWALAVVASLVFYCENCSESETTVLVAAILLAVLVLIHLALLRAWRKRRGASGAAGP